MAGSIAAGCNAKLEVYGFGIKVIIGSFAPNGVSAIDNTLNKGKGFSVVRTAAGLFTVTLNGTAVAALSAQATPQFAAATASDVQFRAVDVQTTRTIQIANSPSASDTDISANASNRIHFVLFLGTSKLNS